MSIFVTYQIPSDLSEHFSFVWVWKLNCLLSSQRKQGGNIDRSQSFTRDILIL